MKEISNGRYDEERAFYGSENIHIKDSVFDGPADGESAFKESSDIYAEHCYFNLRYPFWHDCDVRISDSEMTSLCRAALWYSHGISISGTKMHGIKALRECSDVDLRDCDIVSPEFGWSVKNIKMQNTSVESEYFMMRSENLDFGDVTMKGKYSFQYVDGANLQNCKFDTKDAFWHTKNVTVRDSVIKGEYLAWYSDSLTLINCKISGTQPFCYCTNLRLINCEMIGCDLAFEKSDVEATVTTHIDGIKNPKSGHIYTPSVGETIMTDKTSSCHIIIGTCQA